MTQYGYNELAEEKVNPLLKFLSYLWGPIPWMIEIAAILSAVVRHWADFWIILALLVVNAIVGFWEEYQAGNAIAALKKKLALRAKVKRNGPGARLRLVSWCRATWYGCGSAPLSPQMPNCCPATRSKWISPR